MSELDELAEINEITTEKYLRNQAWQQRQRESNEKWQAKKKAKAIEAVQNGPRISKKARTTETTSNSQKRAKTKPRPAMRTRTPERAAQERQYNQRVPGYLAENEMCHHCIELKVETPLPANTVHHTAGREDEMLLDERFWMAVNAKCHTTWSGSIHVETGLSHEKGWLITRTAMELMLAELIEKRGEWPHVKVEIEGD